MKESVKIDSEIVARIRKHIKRTGQTISGYIDVTLDMDLKEKESLVSVSDYASKMAPLVSKILGTRNKKNK